MKIGLIVVFLERMTSKNGRSVARRRLKAPALAAALVLTGCAPKVTADWYTEEYAPVKPRQVAVLLPTDSVPRQSESIGTVSVGDGGLSTGGTLPRVVGLAVEETAKHGGNILVLNRHRAPDFVSSIHRIKGTMMHTEDEVADTLMYSENRMQQIASQLQPSAFQTYPATAKRGNRQPEWKTPVGSVKISVGPAWTDSKMYFSSTEDYKTGQIGYAVGVSVMNFGERSHGFGLDMYGSHTTYSFPDDSYYRFDQDKPSYTMFYMGPNYSWAGMIDSRLRVEAALGLGMGVFLSDGSSEIGLGQRTLVGAELMLTEQVGIGLDLFRQTCYFKKPKYLKDVVKEAYGVQQFGVLLGVRFYH